ncbi:MAG: PDZ domain-containing protein [Synergistaceae bacterium]|jgi:type II secretion system protein C|nr:PDZ domain-containing protein [Synergistaceae bacterium]
MRADDFKAALIKYAVCAAALGLVAAFILCALSKPFIAAQTAVLQEALALAASKRQPGIFQARSSSSANRTANAFSLFGVPEDDPAAHAVVEAEPPEESPENIQELALAGTIPNIGAWLEAKDGVKFVSKGDSLKGYKLESVERNRAVLSRNGKNFPLFLVFWTPPEKRVRVPARAYRPPPRRAPTPPRRVESTVEYGVKQADPNGADGSITRETLNELLLNPLAEIGKMRLVPADKGMMIMGMNSQSLFSQLGMKPNDVITNINGIGITDVGNVANVISSMLTGTRFDFQIEREGNPLKLGYAVE